MKDYIQISQLIISYYIEFYKYIVIKILADRSEKHTIRGTTTKKKAKDRVKNRRSPKMQGENLL